MLNIKTLDGLEMALKGDFLSKSLLFESLLALPQTLDPVDIPINAEVLKICLKFMEIDSASLPPNYNPLDIKFKTSDLNFFSGCTNNVLIELCNASNYLNYPYLMELICKILANKMQYKSTEELREFIGVESGAVEDIEDEEINRQFEWLSSSE
ncbi:E3 ubiquitin ligase complex SCF subunit sconC [Nosema granulosis]|uniref:E3 ubiquitin ligase complex SCF subunit sconC n=1 Tax=Nosema granulosis TaxID=83296 RepID=A0A9P6GYI4_9MICR|nr:E3 ubiquitin ligase complex SCF subunit sconC [Nosema granulosis]